MSNIIKDLSFKDNLRKVELCKSVVHSNKNIALTIRSLDSDTQVIVKEFRGDYQYRKFLFEAILLRALINPKVKELDTVLTILTGFVNFIKEKERLNNEKLS